MFSPEQFARFSKLQNACMDLRYGADAYAYALVAQGSVGVVAEASMKPWDYMPLIPVIQGAGGVVTELVGPAAHPRKRWNRTGGGQPRVASTSFSRVERLKNQCRHPRKIEKQWLKCVRPFPVWTKVSSNNQNRPMAICPLCVAPCLPERPTETLKRILWAKNGRGQDIRVYKPAFDQRYARLQIVSHEGLAADAEAVHDWDARTAEIIDAGVAVVFFDEVQFFEAPNFTSDILQIIEELLAAGVDVVCSGLDMDWQGKPFPIIAHMAAKADEVHKLRGRLHGVRSAFDEDLQEDGVGGADRNRWL